MNQSRRRFFQTSAITATASALAMNAFPVDANDATQLAGKSHAVSVLARMSRRSRRAMRFAMDEALELGLTSVDSQCLLIGLAGEAELSGASWLPNLGINLDDLRDVREACSRHSSSNDAMPGTLTLCDDARQCVRNAVGQADLMGYQRVEPEHILLALLDDPSTAAYDLLNEMWVESSAAELEAIASLPSWGSVHHRFA